MYWQETRINEINKLIENLCKENDYKYNGLNYESIERPIDENTDIFPYPYSTNAQKALNILCEHFLGKDFYVVDPLPNIQVNTIIVEEIKVKYPSGKLRWIQRN